jgi:hypothetical protein
MKPFGERLESEDAQCSNPECEYVDPCEGCAKLVRERDEARELVSNLREAIRKHAQVRAAQVCAADLRAHMRGADLGMGKLADVLTTGQLLAYSWIAYRLEGGEVRLRVGCEDRLLEEWREHLPGICRQHESGKAERYESAYRPLLAYVGALAEALPMPAVIRAGEGE